MVCVVSDCARADGTHTSRGLDKVNTILVPVFLTDEGYDHASHDVTGVPLGEGKYNLRCVEHHVNIGIVREETN